MVIDRIARPDKDVHGWGFKTVAYHCEKCGKNYIRGMLISDENVEQVIKEQKCECEKEPERSNHETKFHTEADA